MERITVTEEVEVNTVERLAKWLDKEVLPANSLVRGQDIIDAIKKADFTITPNHKLREETKTRLFEHTRNAQTRWL